MNKKRSMIKRRRRKRGRSRFEVIAVNQLSCGARDSLSEGMRDAQIAITELLHLCTEMISSHPHIPIVQLGRWVIKHSWFWTLMSFAAKKQMYSGQKKWGFLQGFLKENLLGWKQDYSWWPGYHRDGGHVFSLCWLEQKGLRRGWVGGVGEIQQAAFFTTSSLGWACQTHNCPQDVCQPRKLLQHVSEIFW